MENTETQYKTFANRFSELLGKSNRQWKQQGKLPPAKFLTDKNIELFLAAQWTYGHNKATTQASKSWISWALKQHRRPPFVLPNEGYYRDLGLSRDASAADVKRAYRRLAIKFHPDKGGDEGVAATLSALYSHAMGRNAPGAENGEAPRTLPFRIAIEPARPLRRYELGT